MKLFLDTNILMDFLTDRGEIDSIDKIFSDIETGIHTAYISVGSFYTLTYLIEMYLKSKGWSNPDKLNKLREALTKILASLQIAELDHTTLYKGVCDNHFKDIEDSYQYQAALKAKCDVLLTTNIRDFREAEQKSIKIRTPQAFVNSTNL